MFDSLSASTLDRRTPLLTVVLLAAVLLVQVAVNYRTASSAVEIVLPASIAVFGLLLFDAVGTRIHRSLTN